MTRKMLLIAGVAGLALTAPATAERGGKKNDGTQTERPQRAERQQVQQAERPQRMERQQTQRAERPQRMERQQPQRAERVRRIERQEARQVERPRRMERQEVRRVARPQRIERQQVRQVERAQRVERQQVRQVERAQRMERQEVRRAERPQRVERQQVRQVERAQRQDTRQAERLQRIEHQALRNNGRELKQAAREDRKLLRTAQFADRQQRQFDRIVDRREMRPMKEIRQQRVAIGEPIVAAALAPVPAIYGTRYVDTPDYYYRYDDDYGYVYRINRTNSLVSGLYPLFGGYSVGDPWPSTYRSSYVPYGYQAYYYDTPDYYYRYDGNAIYQVDAGTQLISGIVALLLGQSLGIGQTLPMSYNTYNVPLAYRSSYYDTNDAWYRYGDGFIYQVDPYSRRIEDRYPIYADNYSYMVGQQWPVAYPGYNVPYAYRDMYYDTPQYNYRYANGGIYQVDPTTQLITALVALVSGQQFNIGQQMPVGYSTYNVPFAYRDRYYDTDDDYYRYANGYVYEVDKSSGRIENAYPVYA